MKFCKRKKKEKVHILITKESQYTGKAKFMKGNSILIKSQDMGLKYIQTAMFISGTLGKTKNMGEGLSFGII